MPSPTATKIVVALAALLAIGVSFATGKSIDQEGYKWISGIAGVIGLLALAYDRWIWRWPIISKIAEWKGRPVLHGTWKGTLDFERDADGNPGSIDFFMTVRQTFSQIEVHSYVSTSESHSTSATLEQPSKGQRLLWFTYRSEAPALSLDTNRPHNGATKLHLVGSPVKEIHGSYWNDRCRRGEIRFTERSKKPYGSFAEAEAGTYKAR